MIKSDGEAAISLGGDLTIRSAEAIRVELLRRLGRSPRVVVDCSAAGDVDLSFIQQIIAARRSAERDGGSLSLAHPIPDPLHSVLSRGGLLGDGDQSWTAKEG